MPQLDVVIVGGGIVGLSAGMQLLLRFSGLGLTVLEKEPQLASHQTGRNSGVIHSGIYYRPGSLKASACVAGAAMLKEFCRERAIPFEICGKLIVAADESEVPGLEALYQRGVANGVPGLHLLESERLREIEPHARGVKAIWVRSAGIVDYAAVARAYAEIIRERGGAVRTSVRVHRIERAGGGWILETGAGRVTAKRLITCGGLHADRLAKAAGHAPPLRVAPFRGEYYDVIPARRALVRSMIYPVPDPAFPFLGVHFTRSIHGGLHAGPNAVLALKREGYRRRDISVGDTAELLAFPGFWRMAAKHWRTGLAEWRRSVSKAAFVRALQRLVPEIRPEDLTPAAAGVRAQALDAQGRLLDDFDIAAFDGAIHVRNVPSPAATASLRIGQHIADLAGSAWGLA